MIKNHEQASRKWHIKPRILIMLLVLMTIIFVSVFCAFNLFIHMYIRSNVETQLYDLVQSSRIYNEKHQNESQDESFLPELNRQHKNKIGARGEVIVLDSNYDIKGNSALDMLYENDEIAEIVSYVKKENIPLTGVQSLFLRTDQGEYYVSSTEDEDRLGNFFVFYVNVSGINHLVSTVNLAMTVIVAVAMLICLIIANIIAKSVTKPIETLSQFAAEIGKGNFKKQDFQFQDLEFFQLGEAMNLSAEKLNLYDKDQRAFFQNVSHELRTPLQSIRCYAEGIEFGLMEPTQSIAVIISETDRLSDLVEDLLYISRVDNITAVAQMCEADVRDTLARCAESLNSIAEKNGLHFVFQFDSKPVVVTYNEKHLYRAFSNLMANALRYAKETITLRCGQIDGHIEISVIDDGPGISAEDLPHVFERFYMGRDGKHGIGLSIVKTVVELHGGEIHAHCGEDTQFSMTFPLSSNHIT